MKFWNELPTRQKILAVAFLVVLIVAGVQFYPSIEPSVNVTGAGGSQNGNVQPPPLIVPQPVVAVRRDPFAVPPAYVTKEQQQSPSLSSAPSLAHNAAPAPNFGTTGTFTGAKAGANVSASPTISLTGVVDSGDSKSIIIRYGSDSRSYRIYDQVGPYEIVAISDHAVTLAGSAGHKVLLLGE
jgi:hypothetical protein